MTLLDFICYRSKGNRIRLADGLFFGYAVGQCSWYFGNLVDPAAIGFAFDFDDESQVVAARRFLIFVGHVYKMPHESNRCTLRRSIADRKEIARRQFWAAVSRSYSTFQRFADRLG